jgi:hypothetical protein
MKTAAMQYVVTIALTGALGLMAATSSFAQARTGAEGGSYLSQHCVPPENGEDAHRFYCRNGPG